MAYHTPSNPRFANIYQHAGLGYDDISRLADLAEVPRDQLLKMLLGQPIPESEATRILTAFNECTRQKWTVRALELKVLPDEPVARGDTSNA